MSEASFRAASAKQAQSCDQLGSPFMKRLCHLMATADWPDCAIRTRLFNWDGDVSSRAASLPLRVAGALHALVLKGHKELTATYPPNNVPNDALWASVTAVLITDAAFIDDWIDSPPQTNEVRRSAALIPVGHWLADRYSLPMDMMELGASAGLNLMWDRFALQIGATTFGPDAPALTLTPDWDGPLPSNTRPTIASRRGVDLNPLDPHRDALRLQAYLWADQPDRRALTDAAIAVQDAPVDRGDAIDWLADHLDPTAGHLRMIYHTIAWQYFPSDVQARGTALIEAAGAVATTDTPLAWFAMEADDQPNGAALTLRLWPGDITLQMGRADFHGRWIKWLPPTLEKRT